jgi:PTS system galactitol-specific IIB component
MMKKRVLVACGTSIATATHAASAVMDMAKEAGIEVEVAQCKAAEIRGKIQTYSPHVIVAMTPVPSDLGVPVFNGVPFLSGVMLDELKTSILEELRKG